jgi:hypothetical protein
MATLYWYKAGADAHWNTLTGNWWNNAAHTSQAAAIPTTSDTIYLYGATAPDTGPDSILYFAYVDSANLTGAWTTSTKVGIATSGTLIIGNASAVHTFNGAFQTSASGTATFNNGSVAGGSIANPTFNGSSYYNDGLGAPARVISGVVTWNSTGLGGLYCFDSLNGASFNISAVTLWILMKPLVIDTYEGIIWANATNIQPTLPSNKFGLRYTASYGPNYVNFMFVLED